jgi:hypothetical protein
MDAISSTEKLGYSNGKKVMNQKQELEKRLADIERQIRETEKRLPAHSVKPPIMRELFDLEDQREALLAKLETLAGD